MTVVVAGAAGIDIKGIPHTALVQHESNAGKIKHSFGGVARNIAENLARLQVDTILLTAVGDDPAGQLIMDHCHLSGIDTAQIQVCSDQRTGGYVSVANPAGDVQLAINDYEIMQVLTPAYFDSKAHLFESADMVVIDMNLTDAAIEEILLLAESYQVPVAADPTSSIRASRLQRHLSRLHLVMPNASETTPLCGLVFPSHDLNTALQAAQQLIAMGTHIAIVTLGEQGLAYADRHNRGHIPALTTHVVDPTGAGDALSAAVIFGLVNGVPLDEAMRLGVTAAALTLRTEETVAPTLSPDVLYNSLVI